MGTGDGPWPGTRLFRRAADGTAWCRAARWEGETEGGDAGRLERYGEHRDAGATWWIEAVHPWRHGWQENRPWPWAAMRERIDAGP
ncbi:MAG: hypothetical protein ABI047_00715 [Jatrophihabitantaceae bacterium]